MNRRPIFFARGQRRRFNPADKSPREGREGVEGDVSEMNVSLEIKLHSDRCVPVSRSSDIVIVSANKPDESR